MAMEDQLLFEILATEREIRLRIDVLKRQTPVGAGIPVSAEAFQGDEEAGAGCLVVSGTFIHWAATRDTTPSALPATKGMR